MNKKELVTLFNRVTNLIARRVRIRPLCAIGLLFVVITGLYVNSPIYGYGRPVYLEEGDNYFTSSGIKNGKRITLTGHISAISIKESGGERVLNVTMNRIRTETGLLLTGPFEKVLVYFPEDTKINIGQDISLCGNLSFFSHATNPGEFDYYNYERYKGVLFAVYDCKLLAAGRSYSHLKSWLYNSRLKGEQILATYLSEEDAAIMKAMLFGNKNEIPDETKELFQKNGIAHILAISGLHISFLAMALYGLLRKLGIRQIICMCLCGLLIFLYGIMVGFTISAFRAICMFFLFLLSKTILRTYDLMSAMSVALILTLLVSPGMIMDTGFQLSFAAVFSVGYLYNSFCKNVWQCPDYLNSVFVSLFIFIGTMPVLLCNYYEVAFYSVILNLVIIPLMSVLLLAAILLVAVGGLVVAATSASSIGKGSLITFAASFPHIPAKVITWILWLYKNTCALLTTLQNGRLNLGRPAPWQVVVFCLLVLIAVNVKPGVALRKRSAIAGSRLLTPALILIAIFVISIRNHSGLSIYQMDVGQGDCQVIINDNGNAYMVDGGSSSVKDVGDRRVIPLLKWAGVNDIDVFLSHPDEDHMNAIEELLKNQTREHIRIKHLYIYEGFLEYEEMAPVIALANNTGVEVVGLKAGDRLTDGSLDIEVICPSAGYPVTDSNNASLVLRVSYGDFAILDTGDVEEAGERRIVSTDIDLLKVAHHGSSTSTSESFLEAISPKVALISAGRNNSYGHPHKDTLLRLEALNISTIRTDEVGCILIKADENGDYTIKGVKKYK